MKSVCLGRIVIGFLKIIRDKAEKRLFAQYTKTAEDGNFSKNMMVLLKTGTRKDENGNSLNACLEKGTEFNRNASKTFDTIPAICNWCYCTADIRKAFLQISLCIRDRDFLKFLWWKDSNKTEIIIYRHCRVVFGISSSPLLLGATISYHLDNAPQDLRGTALRLKKSFYVDNCIASFETEEKVVKFKEESQTLMSSGGFDLRRWTSAPFKDRSMTSYQKVIPILGLSWDTENDEIYCNLNPLTFSESAHTKRSLLSVSQRIFDPIGFTSPTTLIPKLILQKIWKMKLSWDENLPQSIEREFQAWLSRLHFLNYCKISRRLVIGPFDDCSISLHCCSDASKVSYAACIFLRAYFEGKTSVQLVLCKSRVAPAKEVTIPRLELLGALIATRLYRQVTDVLKLTKCQVYLWSDSSEVPTWIKKDSHWNVLVTNHVAEIRRCTNPDDWHYVPNSSNLADLSSRGCDAKMLLQSRWWKWPDWLKKEPDK
ncbi:uncharacterized protein LOC118200686 [Stegodyphus dumicola]|uniref:uncharacterized protein LOC118200686 n=1 Tax=Stegodyphus dumicola TaxID=202533 RepID=UPI0015B1F8B4|nr:uncharacterized protein LOC118200686 [Stegodyphus dumicola]